MKKILLVDDSRTVNKLLAMGLTSGGYEVVSCHEVDEAIAALKSQDDIRLVITDLIMPGKDGNDLIDYIHASSQGTRPKIIAISGGSKGTVDADTAVTSVKHRVELVMMKPFTQPALLAAVKQQIGDA